MDDRAWAWVVEPVEVPLFAVVVLLETKVPWAAGLFIRNHRVPCPRSAGFSHQRVPTVQYSTSQVHTCCAFF